MADEDLTSFVSKLLAQHVPGLERAPHLDPHGVERQLAQEGKSRHDLGRDAFTERVW